MQGFRLQQIRWHGLRKPVPSQRPSEDGRDLEPSASERVGVEPLATKHGCQNKINGSEVGGVKPKVPPTGKSSSEFDVFALSR